MREKNNNNIVTNQARMWRVHPVNKLDFVIELEAWHRLTGYSGIRCKEMENHDFVGEQKQ